MESIAPYVPLLVIIGGIVLFVRWRKSVRYLKHEGTNKLKAQGITPVKPKKMRGKAAKAQTLGDWVPMSLYKEKVVGVTKKNDDGTSRQKVIQRLSAGDNVFLVRDSDNSYDSNAIEVWDKRKDQIGFIDKFRAAELAPQMDKGYRVEAWVDMLMTSNSGSNVGVLIAIQRYKPKPASKS